MKSKRSLSIRAAALLAAMLLIAIAASRLRADTQTTGTCGGQSITIPFTDVPGTNIFFCAIAEAYFSGLTNGTSATTYSPAANVPREQMAAFITRTLDQSLKRGSRRAALNQWWPLQRVPTQTSVGNGPEQVISDGADLWVTNPNSDSVSRVRASDGRLLGTWTGATVARAVVVAGFSFPSLPGARVFVTGALAPGRLYAIDPTQNGGPVTLVTSSLGNLPNAIAFDGISLWTANAGSPGSVSLVTIFGVGTVTTGFSAPRGILYDGANIWVTDTGDDRLKKLDGSGNILQSVTVGNGPRHPVFDGINIWVPNLFSDNVTVVRVKDTQGNPLATPFVLATLTGNSLDGPITAAFDGERILVTNFNGDSVSLWKAADLTPLGSFPLAGSNNQPSGACSDGVNFWVTLFGADKLARF